MDIKKKLLGKKELPELPKIPDPLKEEPKEPQEQDKREIPLGTYYNEFQVMMVELLGKILEAEEQTKVEIITLREIIEKSV